MSFVEDYSHLLVYWPHEYSVTALEASKICCSTNTLDTTADCEVVITDNKYNGKISAKDKCF